MSKTLKCYLRQFILRLSLRRKGVIINRNCVISKVDFKGPAVIEPYCRLIGDPEIVVGKNLYVNCFCHFLGNIIIGNDVQIGPQVVIWGRDHSVRKEQLIRNQPHKRANILIRDDVWIGAHVTILKEVTVNKGAVVGAGSVVVKDVPDYTIVVGNPSRVVGYRK